MAIAASLANTDEEKKASTCNAYALQMSVDAGDAAECETYKADCLNAEEPEPSDDPEPAEEEEDACADVGPAPATCTATLGDFNTCMDDMETAVTDWKASWVEMSCETIAAVVAGTEEAPSSLGPDIDSAACDAINAASCN